MISFRQVNPFASARRFMLLGLGLLLVVSLVGMLQQQAYAVRLKDRSLKINSAVIGATTDYQVKFAFPGSASVGSVQMEFCDDPVPYLACHAVPGLDISGATLTSQSGETGFSVTNQSSNKLILSRTPAPTGQQENVYALNDIKNPNVEATFYIRLTSYASSNASGNYIDYGGVVSATTKNIDILTQVPPVLSFCVSVVVQQYNCTGPSLQGGNYVNFGELNTDQTYSTMSQIAGRTNARNGYSVSVYGIGVTAGNKVIPSLEQPTLSAAGNSQFGINLVANSSPAIGSNQDGPAQDAAINPDYSQPDKFVFHNGDTLITMPGITDFKRYTVSYVLNRSPDQAAGKYGTTLTYICTGFF